MGKRFTDIQIKNMKLSPEKRVIVSEPGGLYLRIQNKKTFYWRYFFEGRDRWFTIGDYPYISLSEARRVIETHRALLHKGIDPGIQRQEQKQAYAGTPTIKNLIQEFYDRELSKNKSGGEIKRLLEKDLLRPWGNRKAQSITGRQIVILLDGVEKRGAPVVRNRLKTAISAMFNFAVMRGILDANPCPRIKDIPEKARDRVLNNDEIVLLWRALDVEDSRVFNVYLQFKLALKLILLTGVRPGEATGMEVSELAERPDGHWWEIPAKRMKGKNAPAHDVPLNPMALEVIEQARFYSGESKFVFRTHLERDDHISTGSLAQAVSTRLPDMKIEKFTPHDLRRTCRTGLASLGVSDIVAEKILSHRLPGVLGTYNRARYEPERRSALSLWENHIDGLVNPESIPDREGIINLSEYRASNM